MALRNTYHLRVRRTTLDGLKFIFYNLSETRFFLLQQDQFFHSLSKPFLGSTIRFGKSLELLLDKLVLCLNLLKFPLGFFSVANELVTLIRKNGKLILDRAFLYTILDILSLILNHAVCFVATVLVLMISTAMISRQKMQ